MGWVDPMRTVSAHQLSLMSEVAVPGSSEEPVNARYEAAIPQWDAGLPPPEVPVSELAGSV